MPDDALNSEANGNQELELWEMLRLVLKHQRLVGGLALAGLLLGILWVLFAPRTYQSMVTVKVPDTRGGGALQQLAMLSSSSDPIETYLEIMRSYNTASRAAAVVRLRSQEEYAKFKTDEDAALALMKKVDVTSVKLSNVLAIRVQAHDPQLAADVADAWAEAFIATNLDLSRNGARNKRAFLETQVAQVKDRLDRGEDLLLSLAKKQKSVGTEEHENAGRSERDTVYDLQTEVAHLQIDFDTLAGRYKEGHPLLQDAAARLAAAS